MQQTYDGNVDIAVLDIERNSLDRITNSPTPDIYPEWSPDSRELVYAAFRDGGYDLYRKSPSEPGPGRPLLSAPLSEVPVDWSRDSRFILFRDQSPKGPRLSALPLAEKGQPSVVAENARLGQFSPDGRWVALESEDSGRWEVYVQPFPGPGERLKVSTSGGAQVRWRRDGRELYYIALDDRLMAVPVRPSADGRTVDIGAPTALFETNVNGAIQLNSAAVYVPSTDGQRFLMDAIVDEGDTSPIEMILNWRPRSAP
jgi:Tol biopolymer transport system component